MRLNAMRDQAATLLTRHRLERDVFATVADGLGNAAQLLVDYHAAMMLVVEDASPTALARLDAL